MQGDDQRPDELRTKPKRSSRSSIGRTRVYELMAGGALRSVKIGRLRCVPVDAVRDYLSELLESAA